MTNILSTPTDFQRAAELKWQAFASAKRESLEDPGNLVAAKRAAQRHFEFMQSFVAWAETESDAAA